MRSEPAEPADRATAQEPGTDPDAQEWEEVASAYLRGLGFRNATLDGPRTERARRALRDRALRDRALRDRATATTVSDVGLWVDPACPYTCVASPIT